MSDYERVATYGEYRTEYAALKACEAAMQSLQKTISEDLFWLEIVACSPCADVPNKRIMLVECLRIDSGEWRERVIQ